jgi:large subunit ribosomal protein L16
MAKGGDYVAFGSFGLKAMEPGWITARQIESARITIARVVRKTGKMWIRIFPDKPITKKPAETRMGKGKGAPEYWVSNVKPGRILFEVEGVSLEQATLAFTNASHKLPIKTKIVARREL